MKTHIPFILLLATALVAQPASAQTASQPTETQISNFISDDDGGIVQIVPVNVPPRGPRKANSSPILKSVQQVSIFLGAVWAEPETRGRERILSDLSGRLVELQNSNTAVLPATPSIEDFTDFTRTPINDLIIQGKLTEMLANKTIPEPDQAKVFVVFLAPGIKSSIGGHLGGIHYAAYHASLHVDVGEVRYVVVPFNDNAEGQANAASQAVIEAAFGPGN